MRAMKEPIEAILALDVEIVIVYGARKVIVDAVQ